MKKHFFLTGISAAVMLLAGCAGSTTTIYDPATTTHNLRQERHVSSEEMRQIAVLAVRSAMTNPKFNAFLKKYKREMKDQTRPRHQ